MYECFVYVHFCALHVWSTCGGQERERELQMGLVNCGWACRNPAQVLRKNAEPSRWGAIVLLWGGVGDRVSVSRVRQFQTLGGWSKSRTHKSVPWWSSFTFKWDATDNKRLYHISAGSNCCGRKQWKRARCGVAGREDSISVLGSLIECQSSNV